MVLAPAPVGLVAGAGFDMLGYLIQRYFRMAALG
jgi:hypothetical protein